MVSYSIPSDTTTLISPQNVLFNSALKQSTTLRRDLETFSSSPGTATPALQGQISTTLQTLSRTLTDYDALSRNEPNEDKKAKAADRLKNFRADLQSYRLQFDELKKERETVVHVEQRNELLGRRPYQSSSSTNGGPVGPGTASTPENPYAQPTHAKNSSFGSGAQTSYNSHNNYTHDQHALREQSFFDKANTQLDQYLDRGRAVLGDLGQQREILKGTQRKLYSVANTLGISGDTIRMVERRARQDKWIFWTGVVVFFVFCALVIYFLR